MRIVFLGTAEIACPCLRILFERSGHAVVGVYTQEDRPKGRKLKPACPPVKLLATALRIPVHQPPRIRDPLVLDHLRSLVPDLIVVIAYGQILPKEILGIPKFGCVNVHTSLLPRWRGAAPIQYAVLHGDAETGITTMYMDEGMDTGDIILQRSVPIGVSDTSGTVHDRLGLIGAEVLLETVDLIQQGCAPRSKQDEALATYASKINKEEGRVNWDQPATQIERQVRAFNPWPGTFSYLDELLVKFWEVEVVNEAKGRTGQLIPGGIIATGEGGIRVLQIQPAGSKRMSMDAFLCGHRLGDNCFFT